MDPSRPKRGRSEESKNKRKDYDKQRNQTRVNIGRAYAEWRQPRDSEECKTDADLAVLLLKFFTAEDKANRHPFVYLPFGAGPRICVGIRLAQLEVKMALVNVLHRFNLVACSETQVPLELKSDVTLGPQTGVFLKITKRDLNRS